jgi:hypothetical protein
MDEEPGTKHVYYMDLKSAPSSTDRCVSAEHPAKIPNPNTLVAEHPDRDTVVWRRRAVRHLHRCFS